VGFKLNVVAAALAGVAMTFSAFAADAPAAKPAASAAKKGGNADSAKAGTKSPATDAVASSATAVSLARYGDANKDPLALIVAARMLKQAGASESKATKTTASKEAKDKPDAYTAEAMIDRAKTLAAGRADIVALADDVAKSSARGAQGGPKIARSVVSSRTIDTWRVVFNGGEPAAAAISGDGDSDLDLFIYDENNNLICSSTSGGDDEFCRWYPRWTGVFYIRIRNTGIANQYVMRTN
jgi:hypothetical protein